MNAERTGYIGQFTADGNGNITSGYMDVNETSASYSVPVLGNYVVYPNQTGFLTIQNTGNTPGPIVFAITLGGIGGDGSATTGAFVEYDDESGNGAATIPTTGNKCCGGTRAQGPILKQAASVINAATNPLVGSYAFAMNGRNPYAYIAPGATNAACNVITATAIPSCGPVAAAGGRHLQRSRSDHRRRAGHHARPGHK